MSIGRNRRFQITSSTSSIELKVGRIHLGRISYDAVVESCVEATTAHQMFTPMA